ncbi:hypothetical protein [Phaeobacter sp. HF9A]|uniref:hypothetical protein n=1 Tax=Phaeobacter sp. HF9A TaxID=2721561 RepID=UPI00142F986E|nr:hypothetical protein [Phaeobacter sp. HF9A]NIZ11999.1 hypothetical protein [Phaeobacter sp. HF9A]
MSETASDVMRDCLSRLETLKAQTAKASDAGLAPQDHETAQRILTAIGACKHILASQGFKETQK